jgi:hypothetical protein
MTTLQRVCVDAPATESRLFSVAVAALELVRILDDLFDALHGAAEDGSGWLRPLAVASVEVEFSVRHRSRVDFDVTAAACKEASDLLTAEPMAEGDFATRYARARHGSASIAALHKRALCACRTITLPLS